MANYPKIIIDETKNAPVEVAKEFSVEHYYDFMHHTHKMSDLVNDVKPEEIPTYDDSEVRELLEGKVDVVEGKSLVSDAEIERLAGLVNYDDSQIREDMDAALDDLFNKIMGITDEDSTTVDEAYDTLKEVSKYITEDGEAAAELINKVAAIEEALKAKLDTVEGKSLVDDTEIERLAGLVNYDDSEVRELLAGKVDAVEGKSLVDDVEIERLSKVDNYDDSEIKKAVKKKFVIGNTPEGALVRIREDEIRVFCPENTEWKLHSSVGANGNPNMQYMSFKAYAPEGAVSFKEGDRGVIKDEMFTFDDSFAGTDKNGNYSICWLALASYDEASDTWTYFGKTSSTAKYIGWDYVVEWYDENGALIGADAIRINLSNENCHLVNEPYYVGKIMAEIEALKNN